jgi:hypothetical protein
MKNKEAMLTLTNDNVINAIKSKPMITLIQRHDDCSSHRHCCSCCYEEGVPAVASSNAYSLDSSCRDRLDITISRRHRSYTDDVSRGSWRRSFGMK